MKLLSEKERVEIARLCRNHGVRRLELFGSATSERFDPGRSDLDLLVEFGPMSPVEHADSYFGFLAAIEPTRVVLYAA